MLDGVQAEGHNVLPIGASGRRPDLIHLMKWRIRTSAVSSYTELDSWKSERTKDSVYQSPLEIPRAF